MNYISVTLSLMTIFLISCRVYGIATEVPGFTDSDKPKADEGIAVFNFMSGNKAYLPNQLSFASLDTKQEERHFVLSGWIYKKVAKRYIFLKKGSYHFTRVIYRNGTQVEEFPFPSNTFKITSGKINYIGDIIFLYGRSLKKTHLQVMVKNIMNYTMIDFHKKYRNIPMDYPLINSFIRMNKSQDDWIYNLKK